MGKIDKDLFEIQMRLVKAEIKNEAYEEQIQRLTGANDSMVSQNKYLLERAREAEIEISALNAYIKRFIDPTT